mmetsp:Transcript_27475/g.41592  ORF Transcript_27475/g.41592 Transcript_27475/m.41592 type:complete len:170 (+) Transcript_27475:122-631(+)
MSTIRSSAAHAYNNDLGLATRRQLDNLASAKSKNLELQGEAKSVKKLTRLGKSSLKMAMVELQTKLNIIDSLGNESNVQNASVLFEVMDQDKSGSIQSEDLLDFIRQQHVDRLYFDQLNAAIANVASSDGAFNGSLSKPNFRKFIERLSEELGVTVQSLTESMLLGLFA